MKKTPPAPDLGWGDDDDGQDPLGGGLDLSRGSAMDHQQSSAYSGGGLSLGDDDDPFADAPLTGSLELDVPTHHTANTPRSMPVSGQQQTSQPPISQQQRTSGGVPDLQMPSARPQVPQPMPARSPQQMQQMQQQVPSAPPSGPVSSPQSSQQQIPQAPISQTGPHPQFPMASQPVAMPMPGGGPPAARPHDAMAAIMIGRYPKVPPKVWEAPIYALKVLWRQMELRQDIASLKKKRSPDVALYERALRTYEPKTFMIGLAITITTLTIATFFFFLPVILRFMRDP